MRRVPVDLMRVEQYDGDPVRRVHTFCFQTREAGFDFSGGRMPFINGTNKKGFRVRAYTGDSKTLLAFNFANAAHAKNSAGFTIYCRPPGGAQGNYLSIALRFQDPSRHAQVLGDPANSTVDSPIQKYRWTVFPGSLYAGAAPPIGKYAYTITPRYFDASGSNPYSR